MKNIPSQYNPKEVEAKWYKFWEEKGLFYAKRDPKKKPYTIVIPPPNVTGILHMGHALNNTLQDILIRYKRMQGYSALWMPGTDHAGIATQNAVEKELAKEGKKRQDLGREKFLERVWKWKDEYGSTIIEQLKRLGASCDWDRTRFTMDEEYSAAVKDVFNKLHKKGLIYQGNYIINWCPRCLTALSDEESEHRDVDGMLYYMKYVIKVTRNQSTETRKKQKQPDHVVIATTRPETMLGDTAVCVNPKDKRYKHLKGATLLLPVLNRELKVIFDEAVDMKFGTGALKVTPAHDPVDFELGAKHKLESINVMNSDATMNENAGEDYAGMDRFECREALLEDLKARKLFIKSEPHRHAVGHCYRCHTMVEPRASKQWFVKMKPLAKPAIDAVKKGKIKFYPARWTKVYLNWMENIRDWCISRQIWWGHKIPVQGESDVLDTWFSSWLWPFATFKDKKDLDYFYPTNCLVTAQEIIFFWVARMIMAGFEFQGEIPFSDVYIHGTVRDDTGTKMSKSLGNIIDPLEIIDEFGADALRFSMISITASGQDVFLSKQKFLIGRNFANKLWNASRFVITNLGEDVDTSLCQLYKKENLSLAERWILSRLYTTLEGVEKALDSYRFNEAANLLYEFIWHSFCDWYLEIAKISIVTRNQSTETRNTQILLYKILEKSLRMLHPFMPFITEEIWSLLPHERESIMVSQWPHIQKQIIDKKAEADMQLIIDIITAVRNARQEVGVPLDKKIEVQMSVKNKKVLGLIEETTDYIKRLAKVDTLKAGTSLKRPEHSAVRVVSGIEIFIPLAGLIDIEAHKKKLTAQIAKLEGILTGIDKKLTNKQFLSKAPKDVVEKSKQQKQEIGENIKKLKKNLSEL